MPLTPLHFGAGLFFGILNLRFFNLLAILFGSIIPDIEPIIFLLLNPCYHCPHHFLFHSIFGAVLGSLILATILYQFPEKLKRISLKFKINQNYSFKILFFSSFFGWLFHIFLDNLTHFDVFLFWPLKYKPMYIGPKIYWQLNLILLILGFLGFFIYFRRIKKYVRY